MAGAGPLRLVVLVLILSSALAVPRSRPSALKSKLVPAAVHARPLMDTKDVTVGTKSSSSPASRATTLLKSTAPTTDAACTAKGNHSVSTSNCCRPTSAAYSLLDTCDVAWAQVARVDPKQTASVPQV
jgi:hypothetical protein